MQLNVKDAALLLNVSEKSIYRWIKDGKLPAYKINESYRFNRAELLEWATAQRRNVSFHPYQHAELEAQNTPSLFEALKAGGIFYRIGGTDKASVMKAVVDVIPLPEEIDKVSLLQFLMARESLGSTGLGNGIAIPHVRNPIIMHLEKPVIALCFLEHPIDFQAIDGKPVDTLFTLISPTIKAHIHLLAGLAYALRRHDLTDCLQTQAMRDVIYKKVQEVEKSFFLPATSSAKGQQS